MEFRLMLNQAEKLNYRQKKICLMQQDSEIESSICDEIQRRKKIA